LSLLKLTAVVSRPLHCVPEAALLNHLHRPRPSPNRRKARALLMLNVPRVLPPLENCRIRVQALINLLLPTWPWVLKHRSAIIRLYRCIMILFILRVTVPQNWTLLNPNPSLSPPLQSIPSSSSLLIHLKPVPLSIRLFERFPPSRSHNSPFSRIPPYSGSLLGPRSPPEYLASGDEENRRGCPRWRWEPQYTRSLSLSPLNGPIIRDGSSTLFNLID